VKHSKSHCQQGPLDPALALTHAQVTGADGAYQAAWCTANIKPPNLILPATTKGGMLVKVIDFGLVKLTGDRVPMPTCQIQVCLWEALVYASLNSSTVGGFDIRRIFMQLGLHYAYVNEGDSIQWDAHAHSRAALQSHADQ